MSVSQVLRKIGNWSVQLTPDAPAGLLSQLNWFGHVAIIPGRMNPAEHGDTELLDAARYVGILRTVEHTSGQVVLSGVGLEAWLGDENGKGDAIEHPGVTLTTETFANAIRTVLPANGAITEGTLYTGIPGTISNTFSYVTSRTAIDYICDTMGNGASWRVTTRGRLDAGPMSSLFAATPKCVIVRKDAGYDLTLKALPGDLDSTRDAKEYSTRVVLVAAALAGGTADAGTIPYLDLHGNPVRITRIIDETDDTLIANAPARAAAALAQWNGIQTTVRLSVDEFDVAGDFTPGDLVWVYDPDGGIYDPNTQVDFRGSTLQPAAVRVLSLTWPVERGYTVAYRATDGTWIDLTSWVDWEASGGGEIEVADSSATSLTPGIGTIGTQVTNSGGGMGDAAVPGVPVFGTFTTQSYQPADGLAKAAVTLTWTQPTNTDSSTIVDGDHYDIRFAPHGATSWQLVLVPWDQTSTTVLELSPGTSYDWQIRAVDYASPVNYGAWSATTTFVSSADTSPPSTPAAPSVVSSLLAVQVTSTLGKSTGGTYNLELDTAYFRVHVGTSSGFTESDANLVGKLMVGAGAIAGHVPVTDTFPVDTLVGAGETAYVKLVAVDHAGNKSTASATAAAVPGLIDDAHISTLTVSKLTAGSCYAAAYFGVNATFAGALSAATGTFAGSLSAATGTFAGSLSAATGTFSGTLSAGISITSPIITGGTITGATFQTATSGNRIIMSSSTANRIDFYSSSGDHGFVQASNLSANGIRMGPADGSIFLELYSNRAYMSGTYGVCDVGSDYAKIACSGAQATCNSSTLTLSSNANTNLTSGSGIYATASGGPFNCTGSTQFNAACGSSGVNITSTTITCTSTVFKSTSLISSSTTTLQPNVYVSPSTGQLYRTTWTDTQPSSLRWKVGVTTADTALEELLALRPVRYYDRASVDEQSGSFAGLTRQWGFIAEEVAQLPTLGDALVARDEGGLPSGLDYKRFVAPIVLGMQHLAARLDALEAA